MPQRSTAALSGAKVKEVVAAGRLSRRPPFVPPRPDDRAAVARALATVDLAERAGDRLSGSPGGQQQRVLIARALAGQPELLLLDEPTAGVDLAPQTALTGTLTELVRGGTALVVVLHEVGWLAGLLDRGVVLREGRIVYDGPLGGLGRTADHPASPRTAGVRLGWTGRSSDDRAAQLSLHGPGPAGRAAHRADRPGDRHLHRPAPAQPARRRPGSRRHRRSRPGAAHRPGADTGRRLRLRGRRGVVEMLRQRGKATGDVGLAILFYGGLAAGVLMSGIAGQGAGALAQYLFGSLTTVTTGDLVLVAVLAVVVLVPALGLAPQLFAVSADEEFARTQGLRPGAYNV